MGKKSKECLNRHIRRVHSGISCAPWISHCPACKGMVLRGLMTHSCFRSSSFRKSSAAGALSSSQELSQRESDSPHSTDSAAGRAMRMAARSAIAAATAETESVLASLQPPVSAADRDSVSSSALAAPRLGGGHSTTSASAVLALSPPASVSAVSDGHGGDSVPPAASVVAAMSPLLRVSSAADARGDGQASPSAAVSVISPALVASVSADRLGRDAVLRFAAAVDAPPPVSASVLSVRLEAGIAPPTASAVAEPAPLSASADADRPRGGHSPPAAASDVVAPPHVSAVASSVRGDRVMDSHAARVDPLIPPHRVDGLADRRDGDSTPHHRAPAVVSGHAPVNVFNSLSESERSELDAMLEERVRAPSRGSQCKLRWIPARLAPLFRRALTKLLDRVATRNRDIDWVRLLHFISVLPARESVRSGSVISVLREISLSGVVPRQPPVDGAARAPRPLRSGDEGQALTLDRVVRLVEMGRISDGYRALSEGRMAEESSATLEELARLQARMEELPPALDDVMRDIPLTEIKLTVTDVVTELLRTKHGVAAGCSGLSFDHLRVMIGDDNGMTALTAVLQLIVEGKIPLVARALLTDCRLLAFEKIGGGIRPIAIGETLTRLAGNLAQRVCRDRLQSYFSENQLQIGVGVRGAAEQHLFRTQMLLERESSSVLVTLDITNAYGTIHRSKIFDGLRRVCPDMLPLAWLLYGNPSRLFYSHGGGFSCLDSCDGVKQGCSLGGLLFSIGFHSALLAAHDVATAHGTRVCAWLDDVAIVGSAEGVIATVRALTDRLPALGLRLNTRKSMAWSADSERANQVAAAAGVQLAPDGVMVLGIPVGSPDFVREKLETAGSDVRSVLERIDNLRSAHAGFLLMKYCVCASLTHLYRSLPPSVTAELASSFDRDIMECLGRLLGVDWSGAAGRCAAEQVSLPASLGGLGIRRHADVSRAASLGSLLDFGVRGSGLSSEQLASHLPSSAQSALLSMRELATSFESVPHGDVARAAIMALSADPNDLHGVQALLASVYDGQSQRNLTAGVDVLRFLRLFNELPNLQHKKWLLACVDASVKLPDGVGVAAADAHKLMSAGSGFITGVPMRHGDLLTSEEFRTAVAFRLGCGIPGVVGVDGMCLCATGRPHTAAGCPRRVYARTRAHDMVVQVVCEMCRSASCLVEKEPSGRMPEAAAGECRPDLAIDCGLSRPTLVDVTTRNVRSEEHVALLRGGLARNGEQEKLDLYAHRQPEGSVFVPFSIELTGTMAPRAADFFKTLTQKASDSGWNTAGFTTYWKHKISLALARGVAAVYRRLGQDSLEERRREERAWASVQLVHSRAG